MAHTVFRNCLAGLAILAMVGIAAPAAQAVPITGSLSVSGGFTPVDSGGTATSLGAAVGIDFDPAGPGGSMTTDQVTGTFALFTFVGDTSGTITDFTFNPFPAGGIASFFTITSALGTLSFDLETVLIAFQSNHFLALQGSGTVYAAGYNPTPGVWALTGQTVDQLTFSWSASAAAVPEPGTLALLGFGVLGLGILLRRRSVVAAA
jgi:hypothetical protein